MGLVVDIVPNHMAADHRNPWWWDVLRRGRDSPHARAFDIDWDAPGAGGKLVLPVLGAPPAARRSSAGELRLVDEDGELRIGLLRAALPGRPGHGRCGRGRARGAARAPSTTGSRTGARASPTTAASSTSPTCRPSPWSTRTCSRRCTRRSLRLVGEGTITGLRIDHVDGLRDPEQYLERLRDATGGAYVVVEKILARDERLPPAWAAAGTTGYDFLALAGGLFVDPAGAARMHAAHRRLTGLPQRFGDIAAAAKRAALADLLAPDLERVARLGLVSAATSDADALRALTVGLDVYRTYVRAAGASAADRDRLDAAAARAGGGAAAALAGAIAHPTADTLAVRAALAAADRPGRRPRGSRTRRSTSTPPCSPATSRAARPTGRSRMPRSSTAAAASARAAIR